MLSHKVRIRKPFAPEAAYRCPLFRVLAPFVFHQATLIGTCIVTVFALERLFARMCALMQSAIAGSYEAFFAVAALMRFVALMSGFMQ